MTRDDITTLAKDLIRLAESRIPSEECGDYVDKMATIDCVLNVARAIVLCRSAKGFGAGVAAATQVFIEAPMRMLTIVQDIWQHDTAVTDTPATDTPRGLGSWPESWPKKASTTRKAWEMRPKNATPLPATWTPEELENLAREMNSEPGGETK